MRPKIEQTLVVDFEELFALKDRMAEVADRVRQRLFTAGLPTQFETELFDDELELRSSEDDGSLFVRMDSYHIEINGASLDVQTHLVAAILLEEAGAYRLTSVEAGYLLYAKPPQGQALHLVGQAFHPDSFGPSPQMLDRRFSMTWEWGSATTGYSFVATDTEDREVALSFKAREGYMALPELQQGEWLAAQAMYFDQIANRFFAQLGWQP